MVCNWLVLLGFGGMIVPAIYAMAGAVWPNGGRQTFNAIYLAQNIGVALGAALGGFVAEFSFNYFYGKPHYVCTFCHRGDYTVQFRD